MKVGIAVKCAQCGHTKKPVGRDAPAAWYGCDRECDGYDTVPYPGSLWPGEAEVDFGYPVLEHATKEVDGKECQ